MAVDIDNVTCLSFENHRATNASCTTYIGFRYEIQEEVKKEQR